MSKQNTSLSFFKQPRLPSQPNHKISFDDINDKYNPFSKANFIAKTSLDLSKCNVLIDFLGPLMVENDFAQDDNWESMKTHSSHIWLELDEAAQSGLMHAMSKFAADFKDTLHSIKPKSNDIYIYTIADIPMHVHHAILHMQSHYSKCDASFVRKEVFVVSLKFA